MRLYAKLYKAIESYRNYRSWHVSNLNFNVHIDFVIKKARKVFGYVERNCKLFHNTLVLVIIFFSCMAPSWIC